MHKSKLVAAVIDCQTDDLTVGNAVLERGTGTKSGSSR